MYGGNCMSAARTAFAAADSTRSRAYALPRDAGPWRHRVCGPTCDLRLDGASGAPSSPCNLDCGPEVSYFG
jgi:hypothetical protein